MEQLQSKSPKSINTMFFLSTQPLYIHRSTAIATFYFPKLVLVSTEDYVYPFLVFLAEVGGASTILLSLSIYDCILHFQKLLEKRNFQTRKASTKSRAAINLNAELKVYKTIINAPLPEIAEVK